MPWKEVVDRLVALPIKDRQSALQQETTGLQGIEWDYLLGEIIAIDPCGPVPADVALSDTSQAILPPAAPFPIDALPGSLRDLVSEGAESIGCPPDYIAMFLLASVSAAIGTTVRVRIKSGWYEWPSLYTAVVAPSGAKKTPAMEYALRFSNDKSIEFHLEHERNLRNYDQAMTEYGAAVEARKRSKSPSGLPGLPDKPRRPTLKRTTVGDTTVEALARRLKENPRGLLLVRDEMTSLLLGMNQYRGGRGNDLQFYLSAWSGVQTTIDRKQDDDPMVLHQPFLSITGGIQPGLLPKVLGSDRLHDGFSPRLLFVDPELLPFRASDASVQGETLEHRTRSFDRLYQLSHEQPFVLPPKPHLVRLMPEARVLFKQWENQIGGCIDALSDEDPFRAPLSKMPGYLGRLALIIHVVKWTETGRQTFDDVDVRTMSEAIRLAEYFVAHATRVWQRLVEGREDMQMRQVLKWMERKRRPVTAREILQSGVAGLKRSHEVQSVIERMEECELIERWTAGRSTRFSLKNPGSSEE